jgi:RNA polymerase sigma-70 factor (ECF subfamily)
VIAEGVALVDRAGRRGPAGPYLLQAAIAACHAKAADDASTDWPAIAALYTRLAQLVPSPVVQLNRAVAVAMADGPATALPIVDRLAEDGELDDYHLLHATRADLLRRLGRAAEALAAYERAEALAGTTAEKAFMRRRIDEVTARMAG